MQEPMWERRRKSYAEEGVVFVEAQISLPLPEGAGAARVRAFYLGLCDSAERLCERVLLPAAKAAYEADPDPRRRFTLRPYRMTLTATCRSEGERLIVHRTLAVTHRGRTLFSETAAESVQYLPGKKERALLLPEGRGVRGIPRGVRGGK